MVNIDKTAYLPVQKQGILLALEFGCDVYLAGGSLLPHMTSDYDLFVVNSGVSPGSILQYWGYNYPTYGALSISCPEAYGGVYDAVVKLDCGSKKIDVMHVNTWRSGHRDFETFMLNEFPLSCQAVSFNFMSGKYNVDSINTNIISVNTSVPWVGTAVKKYRKYYPCALFDFQP